MKTSTRDEAKVKILRRCGFVVATVCAVALIGSPAWAQDEDTDERLGEVPLGEGTPPEQLPPPRSDDDPRPPVPAPTVPRTGITRQAGVGGTQAYGRAGVLELGGSAGFATASNYTRFELSPSIGVFVVDNIELSLLTGFSHFRVGATDVSGQVSATEIKALIEPSFHIPFSEVAFGFLGLGAGVNYISSHQAGFALQPRIGANFLIGRSGVLTPAFAASYSTVDALRTEAGTILAVRTSYGLNIGYTVMW
jgi:hypothetical protein